MLLMLLFNDFAIINKEVKDIRHELKHPYDKKKVLDLTCDILSANQARNKTDIPF